MVVPGGLGRPRGISHARSSTQVRRRAHSAAARGPRYCDEEISRLIDQQSQELDPAKRLALVHVIQRKLEEAAVCPVLGWRLDYYTVWPYVKNLVPHQSIYSWGRMQEVWLDR
jgi:ABC-type transport system substrate-binding protein